MSRDLDSAVAAAAQDEVVYPVVCVELEYESLTSRAHTGVGELTFDGKTFYGVGQLGHIDAVTESADLSANGLTLTLSGVTQENISIALNEPYQNRPATIYLALLNEDGQLVGTPSVIYAGNIDTQTLSVGKKGAISIALENRLVDWDRPRVSRYNNETQQRHYPNDKGFEFVEQTAEKQIVWGRALDA